MAAVTRKRKVAAKPVEVEEEWDEALDDLEDLEEEEEEAEDLEEEEEEPTPKRRVATKKAAPAKKAPAKKVAAKKVAEPTPEEIIRDVLANGIVAFIQETVKAEVSAALAEQEDDLEEDLEEEEFEEEEEVTPPKRRKVSSSGSGAASLTEVREWLREEGYDVADRGRISEDLKKRFMRATKRRIAS